MEVSTMAPTMGKFQMDKFDGKGDFGLWKFNLMGQLEIQGLLTTITEGFTIYASSEKLEEGASPKVDQKKAEKDLRTRSLLGTCVSDSILRKIMNEPTALGMWKEMEKIYQTRSLPNRIYLKKQFSCYKMEEDKTIEENIDIFLKLIADLESLKVTVSDEDQAIQLLSGLPPAFEQLVHTLQYGTSRETLTVSEVVTSAYSKEAELRQKGLLGKKKNGAEGLYVEARGRSSKRQSESGYRKDFKKNNRSKGHGDRSKSRGRSEKEKRGGCFICGKNGHWKRECPERSERSNSEPLVNSVHGVRQPMVLTASPTDTKGDWILDSGCTFHITPNRELLFDLEESDGGRVLMANNTQSEVKGIGKIQILNEEGHEVILTGVRFMPNMRRNLISYGMLEKSGCRYEGGDFKVTFYKGDKKAISGEYIDGLYYL